MRPSVEVRSARSARHANAFRAIARRVNAIRTATVRTN